MESLCAYDGDFVATLGSLDNHFWHLRAALRHFGIALGALAAYGVPLGSLWDYFGISLGSVWVFVGDFASLDGRFAMIFELIWVYEGPFSKKHSSSQQILMISYSSGGNCGSLWVTFGSLLAYEGDFGVS